MAESSQKGWKTLWEKEKLHVLHNFSFSHIVFKRFVLQTHKNKGLFGKGLTHNHRLNILPSENASNMDQSETLLLGNIRQLKLISVASHHQSFIQRTSKNIVANRTFLIVVTSMSTEYFLHQKT